MKIEQAAALDQQAFEFPSRSFAIPAEQLTDRQRALIQKMESGPRKKVPINQRVWMHNISFAEVAERFGSYVSAEAPMGAREKEICILVVAAFWKSDFEWHWHEQLAHQKGITKQQTDAIREARDPGFDNPSEQVTYELMHALTSRREVHDDLYKKAMNVLGRSAALDLIGLAGLYGMIAHTIMLFRLQIPGSAAG